MNNSASRHAALVVLAFFAIAGVSAVAQPPAKALLGWWDITITTPKGELPSWIDVSEERGSPKIVMVGVTDHATPLKTFSVQGSQIEFVSPKGEEGFAADMTFKGKLTAGHLVGTVAGSGTDWHWVGVPAPSLKRTSPPVWGKPISLFNGKDLTGWMPRNPGGGSAWKAENGVLGKDGNGSDLLNTRKFEDFKLHIEFNCGVNANSGVFLRGRYEVQVETESAKEPNSHHTGGVYGFLDPVPEQPRRPDVWQSFDITLVGRMVTVVQNGTTVIDHKEIPGITGGALDSHEGQPGPIYLQASEVGRVSYRNIVITPAIHP
jgi:hypothetical protein